MKYIITNAFSLNMLERKVQSLRFFPATVTRVRDELEGCTVECAIGHTETAAIVSDLLDMRLEACRTTVAFDPATSQEGLIVAQYHGPRLPEGATSLPEGARIEFWIVNGDFERK